MHGIPGLIIATTLAIAGGVCNWLYIQRQADRFEREEFIMIAVDQVREGEKFEESDFDKVEIPKNHLGNLDKVGVYWTDRKTVAGKVATRDFVRNQVLLISDLTTAARADLNMRAGPNEVIMWLPVDPRTFNPTQVNPGDQISFRVPRFLASTPTLAPTDGADGGVEPAAEIVGPFRILALGNRMGRAEYARAEGVRLGSENVVAIAAELRGLDLEPKAQRISQILEQTNFKGVQVLLHPASENK